MQPTNNYSVKKILTFFILSISFPLAYGQDTAIDSLKNLLSKEKNDSVKLELLSNMVTLESNSDFKKALIYAQQATTLA
ncbi:MAG: hypothetical protein COW44_01975, partial [Flavobacteriaceae bacterium CG17_big_fil_post_rev_8_21_14_2_50_33_15]